MSQTDARGICYGSLVMQMGRQSRNSNLRHPFLIELDQRFYESLNAIKIQPRNAFSVDMFPYSGKHTRNSFLSKAKWLECSFLPVNLNYKKKESKLLSTLRKLSPINKKKIISFIELKNQFLASENRFDYIEALTVIPWEENIVSFLGEIHRQLKLGGFFGFTSFGPNSLKSFASALKKENYLTQEKSFIPMIDLHDLGDFCISAGFVSPVVSSDRVFFKYKKAETALQELRKLSGNPLIYREKFLCGKNRYQSIIRALDSCRDSKGYVTLEFELIYGHAWKDKKNSKNVSFEKIQSVKEGSEKKIKFV